MTEQDDIKCIMTDSRIDRKTRLRHYDEETHKFYPRVEAEDHYTITDGQGRYEYKYHYYSSNADLKKIFK